jgi:hypothetical protein
MKNCTLLLFAFFATFAHSQTKLISHKSHSGSNATFATALENDLFDIEESNFGLSPMTIENYLKLDTVVYLSKKKIIRVTSEYTQRFNKRNKQKCSADELVKIRKDTFEITPKSKKIGLTATEVQTNLDSLKIYNNNLSETVYKNFDAKSKRKINRKKKSSIFIMPTFPKIHNSFLMIGFVGLAAVLVYFAFEKSKRAKIVFSN